MLSIKNRHHCRFFVNCSSSDLDDKRRTKRLTHVAAELAAHTGSSLASSCEGNLAVVEGAYRFIENEAVEPDAIAEVGFQATTLAVHDAQLLLAIEDSTTLSYKHSIRSELGDIGGQKMATPEAFGLTQCCFWMLILSEQWG